MKRFFLESYGCQMNDYDTAGMERLLVEHGYTRVPSPADADVLLVNTCSVREHAEERALNRLALYQAKSRAFGMVRFLRNLRKKMGRPPLAAGVVPGHLVRDIGLPPLARSR